MNASPLPLLPSGRCYFLATLEGLRLQLSGARKVRDLLEITGIRGKAPESISAGQRGIVMR